MQWDLRTLLKVPAGGDVNGGGATREERREPLVLVVIGVGAGVRRVVVVLEGHLG